jgi:predicted Fe-Mo cluster-binding NifX family protein
VIGLKNAWGALMSLMDATVDPELEKKARDILEGMPGLKDVEKLRARRAGPFYFLDGHIRVSPTMDVTRTHLLSHDAQAKIKEALPQVESVLLHVEPFAGTTMRIMVPIEGADGLAERVSPHFSRAPYFVSLTLEKGDLKESRVIVNPFLNKKIHAGLAVFHEMIEEQNMDVILVQQIGEIVYHVLRDHGIETYQVPAGVSAERALALYGRRELVYLHGPTHSSEESQAAKDAAP